MKKFKKIIFSATMGIAMVAVSLISSFSLTSCSNTSRYDYLNSNPKIEEYYNNRINTFKYIYKITKERTINNSQEYPNGWKKEYDDLLKMYAVDPIENIDINMDWWDKWLLWKQPDYYWYKQNGKLYMNWTLYPIDGNFDNQNDADWCNQIDIQFDEYNNTVIINNSWDIRLWLDSSTSENPDPYVVVGYPITYQL